VLCLFQGLIITCLVLVKSLFRYSISPELRAMYPVACPDGYEPPPELGEHEGCGGLPGLPFFVQGVVFVVASLLMRYGLAVVAREHAAVVADHGERVPLAASIAEVEMQFKETGEF